MKIRFHEEQLPLFAAASFDHNPLHLSADFARATPFGDRVVYGMLGVLTCLAHLSPPPDMTTSSLRVDFESPLLLGVDYSLAVRRQTAEEISAVLMDGSASAIVLRLGFREGQANLVKLSDAASAVLNAPRSLPLSELQPGLAFSGHYAPSRQPYLELLDALGFDRRLWGDSLPLTALCSSYLTGMELPGEHALFTGMTVDFTGSPELPTSFHMALESYDERFQLLDSCFELAASGGTFAHAGFSRLLDLRAPLTAARPVNGAPQNSRGKLP